jgi:hypothetical protein
MGLSFYIDNQYDNGAVPLERINECDARKQIWQEVTTRDVTLVRHEKNETWNEFVVTQCLEPAAMTYSVLHALEHQETAVD